MTASKSVRQSTAVADPNNPQNVLIPNIWDATAVVTSDSFVFNPPALGLYIGGTGDVAVRMYGNQASVTFPGVLVGTVLPIVVDQVLQTGTTATNIIRFGDSGDVALTFSFIVTEASDFLITEAGNDLITET